MSRARPRNVCPDRFRSYVLPAHHSCWNSCEAELLSDPLERRRVEELELELAGGFDQPIVVKRDHWWSRKPRVRDGVHRSIAAMRSGIPIPIRYGYPPDTEYDRSDTYAITAGDGTDAVMDAAVSLASFRCSAGPWVQCEIAAYLGGGTVELSLQSHPELRELIAAELQQRLQEAGVAASVAFLETRD